MENVEEKVLTKKLLGVGFGFEINVLVLEMKDRCPKSVGDAKQTLEIRVEPRGLVRDMTSSFRGIMCSICPKS